MGFIESLFGVDDVIVKDTETGQSVNFSNTPDGRAEACSYAISLIGKGHVVSDEGSGILSEFYDKFGSSK